MKNNDENIDNLFKEKLQNRSFEIPDAFIADLESKLPAQKKKKKVWLWWLSSFIVLAILSFLSYIQFFNHSTPSNLTNEQVKSQSSETAKTGEILDESKSENKNNKYKNK